MPPSPGARRFARALAAPVLLVALALTAAAGAPSVWRTFASGGSHTVVSGDTLWGIAQDNDTSVSALQALNHLGSDFITVGQTLALPGNGAAIASPAMTLAALSTPVTRTATAPAPASPTQSYTVQPGDTLASIAKRFATTTAKLLSLNTLPDPDVVVLGSHLKVPAPPVPVVVAPPTQTYTVQPGDTLASIAKRFATTTAKLLSLNTLPDPDVVVLGSHLKVPAPPAPVATVPPDPAPAAAPGTDAAALAAAVFSPPPARYAAAVARDRAVLGSRSEPSAATAAALVRAEAARQGVPVALALSIAIQESGLQQNLVSRTDAVGIMQLMPGTAAWLGSEVLGTTVDRMDAASNVRAGVAYLRVLLGQTDQADAIAGYYEGLGNVIEHGMTADTRAYVASVLAIERRYS